MPQKIPNPPRFVEELTEWGRITPGLPPQRIPGMLGGFMRRFLQCLQASLPTGPVALCTVVSTQGSTPRLAGARMAVTAAGILTGTIGGGFTEGRALELARQTLADGVPRKLEADLRGRPGALRDGICGGTMTLWITRLTAANALGDVTRAAELLAAGRKVVVSTPFNDPRPLGVETDKPEAYRETWIPDPHVLIVGAGHIGRCLARFMDTLGFGLTVQDERADWRETGAFPNSCRLVASLNTAAEALSDWEGGRFAALVTRGFFQDLEALRVLCRRPALTYVGMLGSQKRVQTVLSVHAAAGEPEFPDGVLHAPVGLEIGAETPEEIAVSIAAEIIRVHRKNSRNAGNHTDRSRD